MKGENGKSPPLRGMEIRVSGRVQGVGYRYSACRKAAQLNLTGWVRNLTGGDVEIYAEGREEDLRALVQWAAQGPPGARVGGLKTAEKPALGCYSRFTVEA
jgi:acylphosphatase